MPVGNNIQTQPGHVSAGNNIQTQPGHVSAGSEGGESAPNLGGGGPHNLGVVPCELAGK